MTEIGMSRRDFLRTSGAGAVGVALVGKLGEAGDDASAVKLTGDSKVHITYLLDNTGSMGFRDTRQAVIEGYADFVEQQQALDVNAVTMTLMLFNEHEVRTLYDAVLLEQIHPLVEEDYAPMGNTPLYDSIGQAIDQTEAYWHGRHNRPDKIIVVVMTDGRDNTSEQYDCDAIKARIEGKQAEGWSFVFLAANMSETDLEADIGQAITMGDAMGFTDCYTHCVPNDGLTEAYAEASKMVADLVGSGRVVTMRNKD